MQKSLDLPNPKFKSLLDLSTDLVLKQFARIEDLKGYHYHSQREVESWFDEP